MAENAGDKLHYIEIDVRHLLPEGWQKAGFEVADNDDYLVVKDFAATPADIIREAKPDPIRSGRVEGSKVIETLPWLYDLYRGAFLELLRANWHPHDPSIVPADDVRYGAVLNYLKEPDMWFPNHVDTNPIAGIFSFTDQPEGQGELRVANRTDAKTRADVDADCTIIKMKAGHLYFFDGKNHSHYVTPTTEPRLVAAMNMYTSDVPEATRPKELTEFRERTGYRNAANDATASGAKAKKHKQFKGP